MNTGQMHINLFVTPTGRAHGAWRVPGSGSENIFGLPYLGGIVQRAEKAKLDAVFFADLVTTEGKDWATAPRVGMHEPISILGAMAALTSKIGLIASASTSFTEPYALARMMASLDHLSGGRIGWNIVTSFGGEDNFSNKLLPHDERYERAREYVDVVTALWDSWEDTAIVNDKAAGIWARPDRVHAINHVGRFFSVKGPLNVARAPQGWPVLVQAGASGAGADFAATVAEVVFTQHSSLEEAQRSYASIKAAAGAKGRDPSRVKILPGFMPILGDSEAEAKQMERELSELADFETQRSVFQTSVAAALRGHKEFSVEDLDLDDAVPMERLVEPQLVQGFRSRYEVYYKMASEGKPLRDLVAVASAGAGHPVVVGSAEQVADQMEHWFRHEACDGFQLMPSHYFAGLDAITDKLIPVLQDRGLFRKEYEGQTLRDRYGLLRPRGRSLASQDRAPAPA